MVKQISLLGSTGSIGTQSLDVIRAQGYGVFALAAHSSVEKIEFPRVVKANIREGSGIIFSRKSFQFL